MRTYPCQIGVRIPTDLDEALRVAADARKATVAQVVRALLRASLEREGRL